MSLEQNPLDDAASDPHDECRHEIERLQKALRKIDARLRVPAAEYVPAIPEVWRIIDSLKLPKPPEPPERTAGRIYYAEQRMRSVDISYMPVYPGGQKQFNEDCQVLAVAWLNDSKELSLWRWLASMNCTVQRAAVAPWEGPRWFVTDVDNVVLGDGDSPAAAIENVKENTRAVK